MLGEECCKFIDWCDIYVIVPYLYNYVHVYRVLDLINIRI